MVSSFWRKHMSLCVAVFSIILILSTVVDTGVTQSAFGTVRGKVTESATGNPLIGTNVILLGTRLGASTDTEGNFEILRVPPGSYEIECTYVGFKTSTLDVTVRANADATVNFELEVDVLGLDEVVVTGMGGVQIKEKLGVTIASVKAEEIVKADESNIVQSLVGKAPNVEIVKTSGDAGTSSYIRIRGGNTIDRGTQPLFVIDGVPMDNSTDYSGSTYGGSESSNRAADLNNEDIESIEILKGSAAAAIYGSRASNGVVLITTKSGKPGKTRISYKFQYGVSAMNNTYPLQTWYGQGSKGLFVKGEARSWGRPLNVPGAPHYDPSMPDDVVYDHAREYSDGGHQMEHNITVSGGNELTTFFLSMGRFFEEGHWVAGSEYERTSVRLKGTQVITDQLKLTGNIAYTRTDASYIQRADNAIGMGIASLRTPPEFNNLPYLHPETGFHRSYRYPDATVLKKVRKFDNPFWIMYEHQQPSEIDRMHGYVKLEYDVLDWMKVDYHVGLDTYTDDRQHILPPSTSRVGGVGWIRHDNFRRSELDANLVISIQGDKFLNRWDWIDGTMMVGHNMNSREYQRYRVDGQDMGVPYGFNQLDNTVFSNLTPNEYEWQRNIESYFGQMTLDLMDQFYFTAAIRNDGSSTFGVSEKRHWYPKTSLAWEFTKAEFVPAIPYLDFGKVRAAWGVAGVQPGVYTTISAFSTSELFFGTYTSMGLNVGYGGKSGFRMSSNVGNTNIKPERTEEIEMGVDLAFFDSRLGVELTYYSQNTTDVIFDLNVAPSTGYFSQTRNAAKIENKGWEFMLDVTPYRTRNLTWDARVIWAQNINKVVDMAGANWEGLGGNSYAAEGHALGAFQPDVWKRFGYGETVVENGVTINIDEAYAGQWKRNDVYVDENGKPIMSLNAQFTGLSANPDWTGSIRNSFTFFGNLQFSFMFDWVHDGYMMNGGAGALFSYGTHGDTRFRGQERPIEDFLRHGENVLGPGAGKAFEWTESFYRGLGNYFSGDEMNFIMNKGYVKLREISLAYTLRRDFMREWGIQDMNIRLSGLNLKTWTKYAGYDPDTSRSQATNTRGVDYFNQPQTRIFNVSLRVNY